MNSPVQNGVYWLTKMGLKIKYKKGYNYVTENNHFFISFLINRHNLYVEY